MLECCGNPGNPRVICNKVYVPRVMVMCWCRKPAIQIVTGGSGDN